MGDGGGEGRTDSIYYQLFSVYPASFFQLANLPAAEAEDYRFESVEVKLSPQVVARFQTARCL
ncbi:MAG: DUF2887 domain-containing protein [Cyanobacteria bacterium P01_D01_bin.123]